MAKTRLYGMVERIEETAPPGAGLRSWRYEQLTAAETLRVDA
jgi:hypothetical protein